MLDFIAYPLGKFLLFIYNTAAFQNYGLAIIFFTIVVKMALLPLTLKQYKSSAKMQELQPLIAEAQKRYKDDKEKLNQETMKIYQENNYNPASGCLPLLFQMPILLTLWWVIIQPLKFMLGKSAETITTLVEVARKGLGVTIQEMGGQTEIIALSYFHQNREALKQVSGLLTDSELIDFNSFLGLHLGEVAKFQPEILFGEKAYIYLPLLILALLATATTYISTKLSMPKSNQAGGGKQGAAASSMTNTMMYIGPLMTLVFSFQLPAGAVLYWMVGYVFAIFQQLYINKYVINKRIEPTQKAITDTKADNEKKAPESGKDSAGGKSGGSAGGKLADKDGGNNKGSSGSGNKDGSKKKDGRKKKGTKKQL